MNAIHNDECVKLWDVGMIQEQAYYFFYKSGCADDYARLFVALTYYYA